MWIIDQALPFRYCANDIATIRARIDVRTDKQQRREDLPTEWHQYRALSLEDVKESLRSELSRRDAIHRRAQTYLGTVAVLSAFTLGTAGLLRNATGSLVLPLSAASAFTVFFLAGAAWSALQIARPAQLYDLSLQSRMQGGIPLSEAALKDAAILATQLNQAQTLVFSWYSERAYRCLRNGLICLLVVVLTLLLAVERGDTTERGAGCRELSAPML